MIAFLFPALLMSAAPEPCKLPESMPEPSARMAGEGDADWCWKGLDPFKAAGPELEPLRQFVAIDTPHGSAQIVQWRRSAADPVPSGWRVVFNLPPIAPQPGTFREVLVQQLGDNVIVVTVNPAWRIGNAVCSGEGGAMTGYLPAGVAPTDSDRDAIESWSRPRTAASVPSDGQATAANYDAVEAASSAGVLDPGNILCTLLIADADGYRLTFYGPGGRPMPETDAYYADTRWRAVPPGDLERHLRISR